MCSPSMHVVWQSRWAGQRREGECWLVAAPALLLLCVCVRGVCSWHWFCVFVHALAGECVVWRDEGFVVWLDAAVSCSCAVGAVCKYASGIK